MVCLVLQYSGQKSAGSELNFIAFLVYGLEQAKTTALATDSLEADEADIRLVRQTHSPFTIPSTIFFASANSIIVLSRKNSSFSTPA